MHKYLSSLIGICVLYFAACPPLPPSKPVAVKPLPVQSFDFYGFKTTTARLSGKSPVEVIIPSPTTNFSKIAGGVITLISGVINSGWVVSKGKYYLPGKRFYCEIRQASWDFDLTASPTRNLNAAFGLYDEPNWVKLTGYKLQELYASEKISGVQSHKLVKNTITPFWWAIRFSADSIYFEHSQLGTQWQVLHAQKRQIPDSAYIALRAHKTPSDGQVIAYDFSVEDKTDEPPTPPVILPFTSAKLEWRPNTEPDLAFYRLWYGKLSRVYPHFVDTGLDTSWTLTGLDENATYYFAVTAHDTAGNSSLYSSEIVAKTGTAPVDTSFISVPVQADAILFSVRTNFTDSAGVKFDSLTVQVSDHDSIVFAKTYFAQGDVLIPVPVKAGTSRYQVRQLNSKLNVAGEWKLFDKEFRKE